MNVEWFFGSRSKAYVFVKLFGLTGARIFYFLLGFFILLVGMFFPLD
jgi:hypothetical protein